MWKTVSYELKYSSPHLQVWEDQVVLPSGGQISFATLELPDFVTILPLMSNQIVMLRNYRYPANKWFLELPSGVIQEGETPQQCAQRELQEETGYYANPSPVSWYHPLGRSQQKAHVFLATSLRRGIPNRDPTEHQEVTHLKISEALNRLDRGELRHAPTIVALSLCRNLIHPQ